MTTLRIPAEHHWREGHGRPVRRSRGVRRTAARWGQQALLAIALLLFTVIGLLPMLGLYRPVTVLSGSMRPTFSPGDMVLVAPEPLSAVRVGQVVSYRVPVGIHQVETHRIVRILKGGANPTIQTRGDANNASDPWTATLEGSTAWRQIAVIPHLGYLVNALRSSSLHLVAVLLAPALLALLFLADIWGIELPTGRRRRLASAEAQAS